jgi:hypothetical protein
LCVFDLKRVFVLANNGSFHSGVCYYGEREKVKGESVVRSP